MVERVNSDSVIRALRRLTARVELWIFSRGAAVSEMSPLFLNNLLAVALDRDDWMVSDRMWRACGPRWPATIITRVFTTDKASMPHLHEPHSAPMRPLARPKRERERGIRACVCTKCHEHGPRYGQGISIQFDGFDTGYYQILPSLLTRTLITMIRPDNKFWTSGEKFRIDLFLCFMCIYMYITDTMSLENTGDSYRIIEKEFIIIFLVI